jgi:uncharacterized membrane protein YjgN (DUF898 family)
MLNLVLNLLTLGLYWPFAQARRQAFFYRHTWVGEHALGFHANPWALFQAHLLMLVLALLNVLVYLFMPPLAWLPALLLLLLWPALWHASLVFRLSQTRWQDQDLRFTGSAAQAYFILLPLGLPVFFAVTWACMSAQPGGGGLARDRAFWLPMALALTGMLLCVPWWWARLQDYLLRNSRFGTEHSEPDQGLLARGLYRLSGEVLGGVLLLLAALAGAWTLRPVADLGAGRVAVMGFGLLLCAAALKAYVEARVHHLIWSQARNARIRFHSTLRCRDLCRVSVENAVLILLSLGLFWPFAAVRKRRLKLQAMRVEIQAQAQGSDARKPIEAEEETDQRATPHPAAPLAL